MLNVSSPASSRIRTLKLAGHLRRPLTHLQTRAALRNKNTWFKLNASTDLSSAALLPHLHLVGSFISVVSHLDRSVHYHTVHAVLWKNMFPLYICAWTKFFLDFVQWVLSRPPPAPPSSDWPRAVNWPTFDKRRKPRRQQTVWLQHCLIRQPHTTVLTQFSQESQFVKKNLLVKYDLAKFLNAVH